MAESKDVKKEVVVKKTGSWSQGAHFPWCYQDKEEHVHHNFAWTITNYSRKISEVPNGECVESDKFSVTAHGVDLEWQLHINPLLKEDHGPILLVLVSRSKTAPFSGKIQFSLVSTEGLKVFREKKSVMQTATEPLRVGILLPTAKAFPHKWILPCITPEDTLTVLCEITIDGKDVQQSGEAQAGELTDEVIERMKAEFYSSDKNRLAQNVCSRSDPLEACLNRSCLETTVHIFNRKVEAEGKPVTNQKRSGRCWLFACLNVARLPFVKKHNLEDFEFSQGYMFYWDKIERANYFLHQIVLTARRGDEVTSRTVSYLLVDPVNDGGQWDMAVNLITKYGLIPKKCFPETFSSESSRRLSNILKSKLREYARTLRLAIDEGNTDAQLQDKISEMMNQVYRIVGICLGIPPSTFTWEFTDKDKQFQSVGPITPLEFYNTWVKPVWDVEEKICLVSDPRASNPFGRTYTVDCLGNMVGGRRVVYNNQPVELLMDLTKQSILANESVWFGCDVDKRYVDKQGYLDLTAHDYQLVFSLDVETGMDKASRLMFGDSLMTHAMVITGCHVTGEEEVPSRWRVENSWGEDRGEKGYLLMTSDWFKEFVFEVVVDKSLVPQSVLDTGDLEPVVLPAWDPLGALAL